MQVDDASGVEIAQRLRALLDSPPDPHVRLEPVRDETARVVDFVYTDCNPAASEYFGLPGEQILGQHLLELFPAQESSGMFAVYVACLETGSPIRMRDTQLSSEVAHATRWFDFDGARAGDGVTLTWRDVSEAHLAAARLAESEERYRLLADNTTDIVLQVAPDGTILWASAAVARALGWDPEQLVGRAFDLIHPDDREGLEQGVRQSIETDSAGVFRARFLRADSGYRWMEAAERTAVPADGREPFQVVRLRDIEDQVSAERELEAERNLLRATLDSMLDPHILMTAVRDAAGAITDFVYTDANPTALAYLGGMTRDQFVGTTLRQMYPSDAATLLLAQYADTVETGDPLVLDDYVYPNEMFGGDERRYDLRGSKIDDSLSLTWRDVTERHQAAARLAESEELYRRLAENTTDVVVQTALDSTVLWVSPAAFHTLGWRPDQLVGRAFDLIHPDDAGRVAEGIRLSNEARTPQSVRFRMLCGDGGYRWVETTGQVVEPSDGKAPFRVVWVRDVEEQVRLQAELEHRARTDALTGLLTRREGWRRLGQDLDERRQGRDVAVLFIDLDGFKRVNDQRGHQVGDALLMALASRLQSVVRDDDYVVRAGGDELLVVLNDVDGVQAALDVGEKVRTAVALPVSIDGEPVSITASVGATLARPGDSVAEIVGRADSAMYGAKVAGRDQVVAID